MQTTRNSNPSHPARYPTETPRAVQEYLGMERDRRSALSISAESGHGDAHHSSNFLFRPSVMKGYGMPPSPRGGSTEAEGGHGVSSWLASLGQVNLLPTWEK